MTIEFKVDFVEQEVIPHHSGYGVCVVTRDSKGHELSMEHITKYHVCIIYGDENFCRKCGKLVGVKQ